MSFSQRSTIILSSPSVALEYMKKRSTELSPRFDSPCNGGFSGSWDGGGHVYADTELVVKSNGDVTHALVATIEGSVSGLRH